MVTIPDVEVRSKNVSGHEFNFLQKSVGIAQPPGGKKETNMGHAANKRCLKLNHQLSKHRRSL